MLREESQLPTIPLERHPLMRGKENEQFKKEKDRHDLASKLGLETQAKHSMFSVYKNDIEELTSSTDYVMVSDKTLESLFQFKLLRSKALFHNIKNFLDSKIKWMSLLIASTITSWVLCVHTFPHDPKTTHGWIMILLWSTFNLVLTGFAIVYPFKTITDGELEWDVIGVRLRKDNIKHTMIKLPYGAMLKYQEAKETNIFKDFIVASPEIHNSTKRLQFPKTDPAILGITEDNKQYLICYWDLKGDFDRAEAQINKLKNLKIHE